MKNRITRILYSMAAAAILLSYVSCKKDTASPEGGPVPTGDGVLRINFGGIAVPEDVGDIADNTSGLRAGLRATRPSVPEAAEPDEVVKLSEGIQAEIYVHEATSSKPASAAKRASSASGKRMATDEDEVKFVPLNPGAKVRIYVYQVLPGNKLSLIRKGQDVTVNTAVDGTTSISIEDLPRNIPLRIMSYTYNSAGGFTPPANNAKVDSIGSSVVPQVKSRMKDNVAYSTGYVIIPEDGQPAQVDLKYYNMGMPITLTIDPRQLGAEVDIKSLHLRFPTFRLVFFDLLTGEVTHSEGTRANSPAGAQFNASDYDFRVLNKTKDGSSAVNVWSTTIFTSTHLVDSVANLPMNMQLKGPNDKIKLWQSYPEQLTGQGVTVTRNMPAGMTDDGYLSSSPNPYERWKFIETGIINFAPTKNGQAIIAGGDKHVYVTIKLVPTPLKLGGTYWSRGMLYYDRRSSKWRIATSPVPFKYSETAAATSGNDETRYSWEPFMVGVGLQGLNAGSKGDPCTLVYPAGTWRMPTRGELNSNNGYFGLVGATYAGSNAYSYNDADWTNAETYTNGFWSPKYSTRSGGAELKWWNRWGNEDSKAPSDYVPLVFLGAAEGDNIRMDLDGTNSTVNRKYRYHRPANQIRGGDTEIAGAFYQYREPDGTFGVVKIDKPKTGSSELIRYDEPMTYQNNDVNLPLTNGNFSELGLRENNNKATYRFRTPVRCVRANTNRS